MAYATEDDLRERLGDELVTLLADEDGDGSGDASILAAALGDGAAEIDQALAGRYVTPVDPAPAVLAPLNVDLAVHALFLRRRRAISPEHEARHSQARATLKELARGETELEGASERLRRLETESSTRETERHFDRETLEPF